MVPEKFLQSLVLKEIIQMSVFTLLHVTYVPAAWASLWDFFTIAGMDGEFWPCEDVAELVLEERSTALLHGHCQRSAGCSAALERLAAWASEASCVLYGRLLSLQALMLLYFLLNGSFPQRQSF